MAAGNEINKSAVAQILKLLTYLRLDVLIARIEIAKMPLEGIDLVEGEITLTERLHAFHHVKQPAPCFRRLASEKQRPLPLLKDGLLGANDTAPHDVNLAGLGNARQDDVRSDPAGPSGGSRQRLALLDDLAGEEVLWHDQQVERRTAI